MISKVIGAKWKLWLIAGLMLGLSATLYQCRNEVQNAAQWSLGFHQLEEQIQNQQTEAERRETRWNEQTELRVALVNELRELREQRRQMNQRFSELEQTDEQVAQWSNRELPCALVPERLLVETGSRCRDGSKD